MSNEERLENNKATVRRFNKDFIELGDEQVFWTLMAPQFVNRTAAPGISAGSDGMLHMINRVLRPALPDLRVEIHDQVAEGDKVVTRKTIHGTHLGELFGVPATRRKISIDVIDIVRLENGRYAEHWGINTLAVVLAALQKSG